MTKAIVIRSLGGPEVLQIEERDVGAPGAGEVHIRHQAIGLNYIDVYFRTGLYKGPALPFCPGMEGAGTVAAVGEGVTEFRPGDRVAYASPPLGAYAEERLMPADRLVKLPEAIDFRTAAAVTLQGMTAQYLLRRTYPVKAGDTILLHAAAGGVGLLVCQWAKHLGVEVIGTVGSEAKAELAAAHGCTHPVVYTREDFVQRVHEITGGDGVAVVYDSVGKDTFMRSLECLRPLGMMVTFGQSSGAVEPLELGVLSAKGSLFLTRPTLLTYVAKRADLLATAGELYDLVGRGVLKVEINQTFPLAAAADAHRALEGRKTTGSTILEP